MPDANVSPKQVNIGRTYIHIRRIKDFLKQVLNTQVGRRNEFFHCKVIDTNGDDESNLSLALYPGGYEYGYSDYVAIRASLDQQIDCQIVVEVALCGQHNEECLKRRIILSRVNNHRVVIKDFIGKSLLITNSNFLRDSAHLKMACRISVVNNGRGEKFNFEKYLLDCRDEHMNALEQLFETEEFSDLEINVADVKFKVHRCILASQSPVFAAMFRSDMAEKRLASVIITDIDAETMKEFLRFIYVAKIEKLDVLASNLWIAADKYQVNSLKKLCEHTMIVNLNVDSLVETLCFLDKFAEASKLKDATIQFIIDNSDLLASNSAFKDTMKTLSASLLCDVLCVSLQKTRLEP